MIHTHTPEIKKENFITPDKSYLSAKKLVEKARALQLREVSNFGAVIFLVLEGNKEEQLTKKKISWGDVLDYLGLMKYREQSCDRDKFKLMKNELMKHGLIILR